MPIPRATPPSPREKSPRSGLCVPPTTGAAFGTWTPAPGQKVKGLRARTAPREPDSFPQDPKTRGAVLGAGGGVVGRKQRPGLPSSSCARRPRARLRRALSNFVLLVQPRTRLNRAPQGKGRAHWSRGARPRPEMRGKKDIARSGVSPRMSRVVFRGAQARSVSAPQPPTLPWPGPSSQAPPSSRLRAAVPRSL